MEKRIQPYYLFFFLAVVFASCKKFVEIPIANNQLATAQVFEDSANASSAVLGIYISIMQSRSFTIGDGGLTLAGSLSSDELSTTSTNTNYLEVLNNSISLNNSFNAGLWKSAYSVLYQINACIEGIEESKTLTLSVKKQLSGECQFMRAFVYFNLVNIYGGVPLVTKVDYTANQALARTDVSAVYDQILADLISAKSLLPVDYASAYRARPNLYAVSALLAKVYLFMKEWNKAESESNSILTSGIYSLDPNLNTVFVSGSNETIFALQPASTIQTTWEGSSFVPSSGTAKPTFILTNVLFNAFENGDKRKTNWVKQNVISGVTYSYPYKYKVRITAPAPTENYVVFRLAEQYLIHSEAAAQLNHLTSAIADINAIRSRAGLAPLANSLSQSQVLAAIEQERKVELFAEWGNRWFDLKRWNKADAVLSSIKGNTWQATDVLFPIPYGEIVSNHYLLQNPGY